MNEQERFYTALEKRLGAVRMESVIWLPETDSTNSRLRALAQSGVAAGTVVLAGAQTAGRGRQGRSFASPAGTGIYLSMLLRPDCAPMEASQLTAWAAVAVRTAILDTHGVSLDIKWVNDLQLAGKKLCGILTEATLDRERVQYLVLGVGINVNTRPEDFPPELRDLAGSLYSQTGRECALEDLAAALVRELDVLRSRFPGGKAPYLSAYREFCISTGRDIVIHNPDGSRQNAYAQDIDQDFALLVRLPDGTRRRIAAGEVSIR